MIRGMTGFGNTLISSGKFKAMLEIKTVNHRFFDIVFYLPAGFGSAESKMREMIAKEVDRGRITVSLKITEKPLPKMAFNKDAVRQYLQYAKTIKKEYGFDNDLTLSDLMRMPGVVEAREVFVEADQTWPVIEKALRQALASLVHMRTREGKSLAADITSVLSRMLQQLKNIRRRSEQLLKEKKKTFSEDEILSYQKGTDINEEVARLTHYIEEFKSLLKSDVSVGKKLDFVAQEMQRETNTIGSKLQDNQVTNAVIAIKSKIEKLREQAQNIE